MATITFNTNLQTALIVGDKRVLFKITKNLNKSNINWTYVPLPNFYQGKTLYAIKVPLKYKSFVQKLYRKLFKVVDKVHSVDEYIQKYNTKKYYIGCYSPGDQTIEIVTDKHTSSINKSILKAKIKIGKSGSIDKKKIIIGSIGAISLLGLIGILLTRKEG